MLFAHMGVAMAAKRVAPTLPVGILLAASAGPDILFSIFFILGLETVGGRVPWSHSLFMSIIWSATVCGIAVLFTRRLRSGFVLGGLVFSHWILDFIAHPPVDLPLFFGNSPLLGLDLFSNYGIAGILEFSTLGAGAAFYLTMTNASDRTGRWIFWIMFSCFFIILAVNLLLPPEFTGLSPLLFSGLIPIGFLVERHRAVRSTPPLRHYRSHLNRR